MPALGTRDQPARSRRPAAHAALGLALLVGMASCAAPEDSALGTVVVDLAGKAPSGTVYRLRHAVITVTGPDRTRVWNTEDDPDRTSLSDNVPAGNYSASLAPGWNLEKIAGTSAVPVVGELISDNPVAFVVSPQRRTSVPLRFHVGTEVIDMSQGYDLVLGVEESPPQLIIVTSFSDEEVASIAVFEGHSNGDVAPLRTIQGPLTTLSFPGGVAVTDDEIVVCDRDTDAISFFPINASGDVAPTRQIVGDETELDRCVDVAVFNGELYVSQIRSTLVFPLTANGNALPSRQIRGQSIGQYLAIDGGELYVADAGFDEVEVFLLPLAEDPEPTRSIESNCASGIAIGHGELFVNDGCAAEGGVSVYPETADGEVEPLRELSGDRTLMRGPEQFKHARGELYVADPSQDLILIYPETAAGNVAPIRTIGGPHSGVSEPIGIAVH